MNRTTEIYLSLLVLLLTDIIYSQGAGVIVSEVSINARTYYDLQSNSSCFLIEQDLNNVDNLHAVFTVASDPAPNWADRKVLYFVSTSEGMNWENYGSVSQTRSGFPVLSKTNSNNAVVLLNSADGGGQIRFQIYVDSSQSSVLWRRIDPLSIYVSGHGSVSLTDNRLFFTSGGNVNSCVVEPVGGFSGNIQYSQNSTTSVISSGTSKTGVAFLTNEGGAKLVETTNGGVSWSEPINVWTYIPNDSLSTLRGLDLMYSGNTPAVVFEVCKFDITNSQYYPRLMSKIMFWSPAVNGGVPVKVDSAGGLSGSNPTNDIFVSVCRPVLGISAQSNGRMIVAYSKARPDTSSTGDNFFDVYMSCSTNSGLIWGIPYQVTNKPGQFMNMHDCRYVSMVKRLKLNSIYLLFQADTIPGSQVNGASNSIAKMYFAKYYGGTGGMTCSPIGISNTSNEIPKEFSLKQNYPNPFNPATQIEFAIPKQSNVLIIIYNSLGEAVDEILNQTLKAGVYKADWNAASFASGVYFYELKTGDYTATKKMVLLK